MDLFTIPKFDTLVAVRPRVIQDLQRFPFNIVLVLKKVITITNGIFNDLFKICNRETKFKLKKI